ncbi:uncharacterized protein [Setaria viridis]|uniref:uncharacterized protein n=1 Tax=Setaria viridis TaxID=4556 RepID=UPI003B3B4B0D
MGLRPFLEHRCDWNDTIVRQLYATVEIKMEEETIEWMTGQCKNKATFAEFAAANKLDYAFLSNEQSYNIVLEDNLSDDQSIQLYEPARIGITRVFGKTTGRRHHPAVINKIARATVMPKSGNKDRVRFKYWNFINHVMFGHKVNVVALMIDQMADKKVNIETNIQFAPYVMSLIHEKTRFRGACHSKHTIFRPFLNDTAFLGRDLTPFPDDGGNNQQGAR